LSTRFTEFRPADVQVALVLQFIKCFFFQHRTDFAGFPMQDAQVGCGRSSQASIK
jgi:hypothetical protein